ncbi:amidohydrolase family protein [Janthinobacterium sp. HLX7-2]|uniref:amidohydrolase family protein n=1 Tax=Janthinobacterium sp. HLX7-2 TaxID=1259331 RepID=UPI003F1F7167
MKRIDAHQHFWRLAERAGSWPPAELTAIYRDFLPQDLVPQLAAHGIDGTVLVQSMPSVADTEFLLHAAKASPFVLGVVGWVDLKAADAAWQIASLAEDSKLKGLRPMLQDLDDERWIDDPALKPAIEAMLLCGLSFDALVLPRHLPALLAFAQRYPALRIVIDHAAKPPIASGEHASWAADLRQLAALPQVYCKLSGMVTEAGLGWTLADLQPYASVVLEAFGPGRVIWGSDWPVVNLASDYAGWIEASARLIGGLSEQERAQVLGLNAIRFYHLD